MIIDFQRIKLQINIFNCQTFKITQGGHSGNGYLRTMLDYFEILTKLFLFFV